MTRPFRPFVRLAGALALGLFLSGCIFTAEEPLHDPATEIAIAPFMADLGYGIWQSDTNPRLYAITMARDEWGRRNPGLAELGITQDISGRDLPRGLQVRAVFPTAGEYQGGTIHAALLVNASDGLRYVPFLRYPDGTIGVFRFAEGFKKAARDLSDIGVELTRVPVDRYRLVTPVE